MRGRKSSRTPQAAHETGPAATAPSLRWGRPLTAILILAAGVRLLYFLQMRHDLFAEELIIDAQYYDSWAQRILRGAWLGDKVFFQDPLYAYFLAACYALVGHSLDAVRLLQIALDIGAIGLIFAIGRNLFGARAGLIAAFLGAIYGPMVCFTCLLDKTTLTVFLTSLSLTLLVLAQSRSLPKLFFLSGLAFGLAATTRGNLLAASAALTVWLYFLRPKTPSILTRAARPAAFLAGISLAIAPLALRNYVVGHEFVPLTSNAGLNFYFGNNPFTPGNFVEPPFIREIPEEDYAESKAIAERAMGRSLDRTSEVSRYWFAQGMAFIREDPRRWLALETRKLFLLLNSFEIPETFSFYYFQERYWALRLAPIIFGVLLPLGLAGLLRSRSGTALKIFLAAYAFSVCVFFVTSRYRFPIVIPLMIFAGQFIDDTFARLGATGASVRKASSIAVFGLAILSNWRPGWMTEHVVAPGLATPHSIAGFMLGSMGRIDESIRELELSRSLNPNDPHACAVLADAYEARGEAEKALPLLIQAVTLNPQFHEAFNNLGKLYFDHHDYPMALKAFQAACMLKPDESLYRANLERVRRILGTRNLKGSPLRGG